MPRTPLFRAISFVFALLISCTHLSAQQQTAPTSVDATPALGINFVAERSPYTLPNGSKTTDLVGGGAVVNYMFPASPALSAGLKNGDVIMAMGGKRVCNSQQPASIIAAKKPGDDVEIVFYREGALKTITARVSSWNQIYPNAELIGTLRKQIDQVVGANNYKAARDLCKKIPDDQQIEATLTCIDAYRNRWDYKELRKAVEGLSARCQKCLTATFAHSWQLHPTTDEGIKANSELTGMLSRYRQAEMDLLRKMDQDYWTSIAALPPGDLITKYVNMAVVEGSCRDVPPSAVLVEGMIQFAKQNGTAVLDIARKKAEEARSAEKSAKDAAGLTQAAQKWNEAIWVSPWWSEPYVRYSALLDKMGRPKEAAEVSKLALMIPTAPTAPVSANAAMPLATAPDDGPSTPEALQNCATALAGTEKGGDIERNARQKCARIAGKLPSKPPIPDSAQRYFARGEAAVELGQSPAEFLDAAVEYSNALRIAPWWAEAHCGLGQANEKAGRLQEAIFAYQGCVLAAPSASNVQETQKRIYKLEYAADREQKQAISTQIQQRETELRIQSFTGVWINKSTGNPYSAVIKDGLFVATRTPPSDRYNKYQGDYVIKGKINGDKIEGTFTDPPLYNTGNGCTTPQSELSLSGTISPDGRMMTVKYQSATFQTNGIRGNLFNLARCTFLQKIGEQTVMMILQKQD